MLVSHSFPNEIVFLVKHSVTYFSCEEEHPAVKKGTRHRNIASNLKELLLFHTFFEETTGLEL